ncbi:hypothetical protein MA20_31880 [Bradyrhizobium japonicum]|uniref:Uncharacterized protein n=2 Tax=Bradyrhizobium japonicum TaxID=375 RepID=A0A0A3XRK3_BRAJP|nr:hypothetical protein MA20_31880 [Bradyrhizobium japonicum]
MDALTFFVTSNHLKVRLTRLSLHPDLWKYGQGTVMTPTFKGLGSALAKLKHDLDLQAEPLMADIVEVAGTAPDLLKQAQVELARTKQAVADIKGFVEGLTGSNGGPPLSGSSSSSEASGTVAETVPASSDGTTDQKLTVNGVQA